MQKGETGTVHETALATVMQGILDQLQQFAAVRMALEVLKVPHQSIHQTGVDGEVFADSQPCVLLGGSGTVINVLPRVNVTAREKNNNIL
jgi:hypothetical protein